VVAVSVFAEFSAPSIRCPFEDDLQAYPAVSLEFERVVPLEADTQYLWLIGNERDALLADLEANPTVETLVLVDELSDRTLIRATWPLSDNPVFQVLLETEGRLANATATADGWRLALRGATQEDISQFYTECLERGLELTLHHVNARAIPGASPTYGLSSKQREAILAAFERGYFGVPREVTIARLAEVLEVSPQAVSERLRRGIQALVATTLPEGADESGPETETDESPADVK
jgi:predicted DNA binding protein